MHRSTEERLAIHAKRGAVPRDEGPLRYRRPKHAKPPSLAPTRDTPPFQAPETVNCLPIRAPHLKVKDLSSPLSSLSSPFFFLSQHQHLLTNLKMFSKLTTKLALRKAGISSKDLSFPDYESKSGSKDPNAQDSPFANPFANLTLPKSLISWQTPPPPPVEVAATPILGTRAPTSSKLRLPIGDGRSTIVIFLRHCGCPCKLLLNYHQIKMRC
jgi:hypothetical protein